MSIEVTLRHVESDEVAKQYAERNAEQLMEKFPRLDKVHVIIDKQRHLYSAEVVSHQKGQIAEAEEHATNVRAAIDTASARVARQLRKTLKKRDDSHFHQKKHV